jgi:hypothetical protein
MSDAIQKALQQARAIYSREDFNSMSTEVKTWVLSILRTYGNREERQL